MTLTADEKERLKKKNNEAKAFHKKIYEKCPFIWPRAMLTRHKLNTWDFISSSLDSLPIGWKRSFIPEFCEEIQGELNKIGEDEDNPYVFTRINSLFGHLTVHSSWTTDNINEIIKKYEVIGLHTCEECGKKATVRGVLNGIPYCDKCAEKYKRHNTFIPVDEFKEFGQDGY